MLQRNGVAVGIITGRTSKVVEHRVRDLGIAHVYQGCKEKLPVYQRLIHDLNLTSDETAFVGDDVVDLPILLRVGLAIAVNDAHHLVKRHAHWVTPHAGGQGAGRDVCEMFLFAHGKYEEEMLKYFPVPADSRQRAS
jgi:3-deoxy-D-manno-octulosonate 8-phosphate phosphatase (KDO 8-P phosphatase)